MTKPLHIIVIVLLPISKTVREFRWLLTNKRKEKVHITASNSSHASTPPCSSAIEESKSLEFLGLECDDLNNFRAFALREISAIKSNLEKIADKVEEHSLAIEEIQTYSYRFNVKLLGVRFLSFRHGKPPCRQLHCV